MYVIGDKIPLRVSVEDVRDYIVIGCAARVRAKKSDPYEKYKTEEERNEAILNDARQIAATYREKAKTLSLEKLRQFYKEILQIQTGYDPVPRVGDLYEGHTVTDVIITDRRIELYGVIGKLPKRELARVLEEAAKMPELRDKFKRRGYRFAVLEVM